MCNSFHFQIKKRFFINNLQNKKISAWFFTFTLTLYNHHLLHIHFQRISTNGTISIWFYVWFVLDFTWVFSFQWSWCGFSLAMIFILFLWQNIYLCFKGNIHLQFSPSLFLFLTYLPATPIISFLLDILSWNNDFFFYKQCANF